MLFTDPVFLFYFLPITLLLFRFSLTGFQGGKIPSAARIVFILATIVFHGFQEVWWLIPFLLTAILDFLWSRLLAANLSTPIRKTILALSVTQNLLLLLLFKYSPWVARLVPWLPQFTFFGDPVSLPAGISFYTFESLSFVIDCYRREVTPSRSFLDLMGFLAMFPRFITGPIVRYSQIAPQCSTFHGMRLTTGFPLFAWGFFLKTCVADQFAIFVPYAFGRASDIGFLSAWVGTIAYSMQLYFDFSGYSLMACGLGRCFGFEFPDNFRTPYLSRSVQEFWTRWHITLGQWVRLYFFLPLALRLRHSRELTLFALFLSFLLIGVWHGANVTFLMMGGWFGFWVVLENIFPVWPTVRMSGVTTFLIVMIGWILGRSKDLPEAAKIIRALLLPWNGPAFTSDALTTHPMATFFCAFGILLCFYFERRVDWAMTLINGELRRSLVTIALLSAGLIMAYGSKVIPFLYFQF